MSLSFSISAVSDVPIFRQIAQQVRQSIVLGRLRGGDQLPSIRSLAQTLGVTPNTVARSYKELIRDGVLLSQAGRGFFVKFRASIPSKPAVSTATFAQRSPKMDVMLKHCLKLVQAMR